MKNAQQAGMLCNEGAFQVFLKGQEDIKQFAARNPDERWTFLRNKEDAAIAVRFLIGIDSRRELDTNHEAGINWLELVAEYELWKKGI